MSSVCPSPMSVKCSDWLIAEKAIRSQTIVDTLQGTVLLPGSGCSLVHSVRYRIHVMSLGSGHLLWGGGATRWENHTV